MRIRQSLKLRLTNLCLSLPLFQPCYGQEVGGRTDLIDDIPTRGALCAIKKAYQLTDVSFTPIDSIPANPQKKYKGGEECKGLIYSSVKEIDTFVGIDVSLHTFMTALHNGRSVLYTEDVSKLPYHGVNCGAYYGVVCNTFVSYALGLTVSLSTSDIPVADDMMLVEDQTSRGVRLADVVHQKGHVMLVTRIRRDPANGNAVELEISEARREGCRRFFVSGKDLNKNISAGKWRLYRYKYLDLNTYRPLTDFVAVDDEELTPFIYNDDICTTHGDKACFVTGDTVTLNISEGFKYVEIYKDAILYQSFRVGNERDIILTGLPYGNYKARLVNGDRKSDFTQWKVIDVKVDIDVNKKTVSFLSSNSTPVYLEFCTKVGARPTEGVFELTDEDLRNGMVDVSRYSPSKMYLKMDLYVKVHFECEYGRVINKPIKWE